ncbi:hypothetical protein K2X40_05130 [Candidatus Babeliales bacterium]|nr:hypothetical protein [Candidatus Babeliales bacterium]
MNTFNKIMLVAALVATAVPVDTHAAASSQQKTRSKRGRNTTALHLNKTQRTNRLNDASVARTTQLQTTQVAPFFDRKKIMGGLLATGLTLDAAITAGALSDHGAFYPASQLLMLIPVVYYSGKLGFNLLRNKLVRRQPFNTFVSQGTSLAQESSESNDEQDFGSGEELTALPGSTLFDGVIGGNTVLPLPLLPLSLSSSNLPVGDAPEVSDFFLQQTLLAPTLPELTAQAKSPMNEQLLLLLPVFQEGSDEKQQLLLDDEIIEDTQPATTTEQASTQVSDDSALPLEQPLAPEEGLRQADTGDVRHPVVLWVQQ